MDNGESLKSQISDRSSLTPMAVRKQYSRAELTEITRLDPKRAKKIMTNRQSAMRCKQRKELYLSELEERAQILKMETSRLSSRLAILREIYYALTFENKDLKLRLEAMEENAKLQDELTSTLEAQVLGLRGNSLF